MSQGRHLLRLLITWLFLSVLWLSYFSSAQAIPPSRVQVQLFSTHPVINAVTVQGPLQLTTPAGLIENHPNGSYQIELRDQWLLRTPKGNRTYPRTKLVITSPKSERGIFIQTLDGRKTSSASATPVNRKYLGQIILIPDEKNNLKIINRVPLEHYVCAVVGSETPPQWSSSPKALEAFKAMAILTQSRIALHQKNKRAPLLQDSTQDENYWGATACRNIIAQAVHRVWGTRLQTQSIYYHSCCGGSRSTEGYFLGQTSTAQKPLPPCPYCKASPFYKWKGFFISHPNQPAPQIINTDAAGRPLWMINTQGKKLSGYKQWLEWGKQWGWGAVPGTHFRTETTSKGTWVWSRGAGHGVGLCQWGAYTMALQGKSYLEILHFYFPNVAIHKVN